MTDTTPTTTSLGRTPFPPSETAGGIRTAEQLLADLRAEISRADTKASVLIGAVGVCAGAVVSRFWDALPADGAGHFLGVAGGMTWALAFGFLLFATAPRYRASRWRAGRPLTYFLDIRLAASSGLLTEALHGTEEDRLTGLVIALGDTSHIVAAKHRWIRVGLACFLLGTLALGGSALAGA
ncbi:Pycsar system effector family protein [Streptomyces sp. NPDC086554]|uniref:Pycsar system effector family protein n=1 Tax=Streptomyces sp. NPDC086554 TaxID=3154864 RepID=UPI0034310050